MSGASSGGLPPELQGRLDDLWFENHAGWARAHPTGMVVEVGGWRIASLGSSWAFHNVATAVAGEDVDLGRLRASLADVDGYRVWLRDGMEIAESRLLGAGFSSQLAVPAYVLFLESVSPAAAGGPAPVGYEIDRASSREDIEECVWGDRSSPWAGVDDAVATFPDPWAMARSADRRFYQARQDGRLVATGQSLLHRGVAGVYGMWTADAHRSRGLGGAILGRILADAAGAGADHATLQATRPGGGLYTAAGFNQGYGYRVYRGHNPR